MPCSQGHLVWTVWIEEHVMHENIWYFWLVESMWPLPQLMAPKHGDEIAQATVANVTQECKSHTIQMSKSNIVRISVLSLGVEVCEGFEMKTIGAFDANWAD